MSDALKLQECLAYISPDSWDTNGVGGIRVVRIGCPVVGDGNGHTVGAGAPTRSVEDSVQVPTRQDATRGYIAFVSTCQCRLLRPWQLKERAGQGRAKPLYSGVRYPLCHTVVHPLWISWLSAMPNPPLVP